MDQIQHKFIEVDDGLKLHVADIGSGSSVVLFLHGFPEIWYSWRHQMIAVAKAGYRAIAPDYRGYGLSDPPPEPHKSRFADFIKDLVALLDALSIPKVFLVGKDFGAPVAYFFALFHQERVKAIAALGLPFRPAAPHHKLLPEGFYVTRWRERGRTEADFGRFDRKTVVRKIYILFSKSEIPIANENQEIMDLVEPSAPLPSWMTEGDFATYEALYEKSGFETALQVPYGACSRKLDLEDPKIEVPTLYIMGEKDYVFKYPGTEDYLRSDEPKCCVPDLETKFIPEGSHFVQEQFPDEVDVSVRLHYMSLDYLASPQDSRQFASLVRDFTSMVLHNAGESRRLNSRPPPISQQIPQYPGPNQVQEAPRNINAGEHGGGCRRRVRTPEGHQDL